MSKPKEIYEFQVTAKRNSCEFHFTIYEYSYAALKEWLASSFNKDEIISITCCNEPSLAETFRSK